MTELYFKIEGRLQHYSEVEAKAFLHDHMAKAMPTVTIFDVTKVTEVEE